MKSWNDKWSGQPCWITSDAPATALQLVISTRMMNNYTLLITHSSVTKILMDFDEFWWIWWILMDFDRFFWNLLIFDQNLAFATQKIIIKKFSNFFIFVTNIKTLLKTCFLLNITYQLTVTMKICRSQYHWSEDTFLQK